MVPCWWPAAPDVIWHIYSHLYCSTGYGGRESPSSGDVALTMGAGPLWVLSRLAQIQFFRGSQVKGPSSLALPRMVSHQWPVALVVIWHIYSWLACSSEYSARDLPSSGKVVLGQVQVPCELRADWPNSIFQPAAPDVIWHIYSHLYCSSRDGSRDLLSSGEAAPTMERYPVSFRQISLGVVFQGKSWDKGPSNLVLPRTVHHLWPVAPDVICHIYSHLYCSSRDGGRALPSSGKAAPTMGQVPCEFRADRPTFIFQLAAPDVIWHIYSHLYCSSRDSGRDLLSSGEAAPTMGKISCEFWADRPNFIFQPVAPDAIWHIYSHLFCSLKDGGRDLQSLGKAAPTMGKISCEFWADQPNFIFQLAAPDVIWHIYSHLYCSSRDFGRDLPSSAEAAPTMAPDVIWHIYSGQCCFKGF